MSYTKSVRHEVAFNSRVATFEDRSSEDSLMRASQHNLFAQIFHNEHVRELPLGAPSSLITYTISVTCVVHEKGGGGYKLQWSYQWDAHRAEVRETYITWGV